MARLPSRSHLPLSPEPKQRRQPHRRPLLQSHPPRARTPRQPQPLKTPSPLAGEARRPDEWWREIGRPGGPGRGPAPRTGVSALEVRERGPQKQVREMGHLGGQEPPYCSSGLLGVGGYFLMTGWLQGPHLSPPSGPSGPTSPAGGEEVYFRLLWGGRLRTLPLHQGCCRQ